MKIYKQQLIEDLQVFYGDLLTETTEFDSIRDHLEALSQKMWEGVKQGEHAVLKEVSNYHPRHLGKSNNQLAALGLTEQDCKLTIAREYGFRRWTEVMHVDAPYNTSFEQCINTFLGGNFTELKKSIKEVPALLNQKSQYGHKATLLHYATSNGVEFWRQFVPLNLPEMVAFLVSEGANLKAKMKVYGGEYTAAELLPSSVHPKEAGVAQELKRLLDK